MSFQLFSNYKPSRNESFQIRDSVILRNVYTSERTKRERKTGSENPHIAAKIPSLSANIFRIQLPHMTRVVSSPQIVKISGQQAKENSCMLSNLRHLIYHPSHERRSSKY